jgi:hypothetical protein
MNELIALEKIALGEVEGARARQCLSADYETGVPAAEKNREDGADHPSATTLSMSPTTRSD